MVCTSSNTHDIPNHIKTLVAEVPLPIINLLQIQDETVSALPKNFAPVNTQLDRQELSYAEKTRKTSKTQ